MRKCDFRQKNRRHEIDSSVGVERPVAKQKKWHEIDSFVGVEHMAGSPVGRSGQSDFGLKDKKFTKCTQRVQQTNKQTNK